MKKLNLLKLFVVTLVTFAATAFTGCVDDNEDSELPYLQVAPTTLAFDASGKPAEGSTGKFVVKANRPWRLVIGENDNWVRPSATSGKGAGEVSFNIEASAQGRTATLTFQLYNVYGSYKEQSVTVTQGDIAPPVIIYNETFGTEGGTANPYPFLDQYTGFKTTGVGAEHVTYSGSGVSLRNTGSLSAGYPGASGSTKAFFGSGSPYMVVNNIELQPDQTNLKLTFGGVYYEFATKDNVFKPEKFHVYLSADGTAWSEALDYTTVDADDHWVYATANFTLTNPVSTLYIKFVADAPSVFAIDDPTLETGNGGQPVDLGGSGALIVSPLAVSLGNTAGAVSTVTVTAADTWNATLTGSGFSIDKTTAAAGTSTVTVTAANANTTSSSVSLGTIVFTSGEDTRTVTVTQQAGGTPAGDEIITDFTVESTYPAGFPATSGDKQMGPESYTFDGVTYTLAGGLTGNGYYRGKEYQGTRYYLMIGKKGAYIDLPANATKALTKVTCTVPGAASANVMVGISTLDGTDVAGGAAIKWEYQDGGSSTVIKDRTYTYNLTGTQANTKYRLYITAENANGYNAQIYKLQLNYGGGDDPTQPTVSVNPDKLDFSADADNTGKTITVTTTNQGAYNLYAKSSDNTQFPTTLSGNTVTVKALANSTSQTKNATITVYLATAEGMTPVAQKTVAVSQQPAGSSSDDIFFETFGTPVKDGTYWPYANDNASNIKSGTGFVAGTTTYKGYSTTARIADKYSSPNPPFSGEGHCWFPANKTIDKNYFEVDKLVMAGQKNLTFEFAVFGNTEAYVDGAIVLEVSADGTAWTSLNFAVTDVTVGGTAVTPAWKLAKADITLVNAVSNLYVKWSSAVGDTRVDDMRIYEGNGGQSVDLGGSSETPTLEVSPLDVTLNNTAGATKTFTVTTTAAWTATASGAGFTINPTSGTGNATVTVTASAANTVSSEKTLGSVLVSATGVSATKTVTVKQAAGGNTPPAGTIVVDFQQGPGIATPAIPTSKVTGPVTDTYTIAGYEFVVNAPAAYFFQDGSQYDTPEPNRGLYISKEGAYLGFPAIAGKSLQKVVVSTPNSSGSGIMIAINDAEGLAAEGGTNQTIGSNETVTFNLSNTLENTSYRIEVMNSKNFQINKLELTYSDGGETPPPTDPEITAVNPTSLSFPKEGGNETIAVTVANQGSNALSVSGLTSPFSASVNGNTVTVTAQANTGAAVNQTLTISVAGGNSKTVPVSIADGQSGGGENTVEINYGAQGWANQTPVTSVTEGPVTVTFDKAAGSNAPTYYTTGAAVRAYSGNTLTVSGVTVSKIEYTFVPDSGATSYNNLSTPTGTYSGTVWTGSADEIAFTVGKTAEGKAAQSRIQKMVITYTE